MGSVELTPNRKPAEEVGIEVHFGAQDKINAPPGWNPEGSPGEKRRNLKAYVDSVWATDRLDRQSVSGVDVGTSKYWTANPCHHVFQTHRLGQ
eukprot:3355492-Amphidinium_carterae.1